MSQNTLDLRYIDRRKSGVLFYEQEDLILVKYGDSYGYVRKSELDDDGVTTPEEAVERIQNYQPRKINVYMQMELL